MRWFLAHICPTAPRGWAAGLPSTAGPCQAGVNLGEDEYVVYTTDLSPEYVDLNRSEYAYWNQAKQDGLTK